MLEQIKRIERIIETEPDGAKRERMRIILRQTLERMDEMQAPMWKEESA